MIQEPIDILKLYPIRKKKAQKEAFRSDVLSYARKLGYEARLEEGKFGARNIVIGNPEKAKYLVSAHYDTPASIGLPNFITPCNFLVYILWQLVIVSIFWVMSLVPVIPVYLLTQSPELTFIGWYVAYFALRTAFRAARYRCGYTCRAHEGRGFP